MSAQYTMGNNFQFYSFDYCVSVNGNFIKMGFKSHPDGASESGVFPMQNALEAATQSALIAMANLTARKTVFDHQKEWDWLKDTYLSDMAESVDIWRAAVLRKAKKLN